ncbi:hypothetical protein ACWT_4331 [Actinoplanes sp. SE50]|uniref:hypothetical protein n=1 Tax=unclassified Actinoplanes TaxID=2626549 RepID=UPI00023EC803|nr:MULTISPECIES: hypothetical protein [unclassified Actinoplanes]AEV85351.1 hypothetical protein ACPL_4460 [Actinoplanes sp. SE50/110]ATO83746.1 hypothetical protein ACWT_4331 [Actinoplanes sp. SE50]SLM01154.1 hypothetical protein ACSP50_4387 [Actinoplanes sp. SE50/110]
MTCRHGRARRRTRRNRVLIHPINVGSQDVAAAKGDTFTSIAHLDLGGNRHYGMVMTGGETSGPVQAAE